MATRVKTGELVGYQVVFQYTGGLPGTEYKPRWFAQSFSSRAKARAQAAHLRSHGVQARIARVVLDK